MSRKAILLTIGAAPLPVTTPIVPVTTVDTVDTHTAPALPAPTDLTVAAMLDAGHLAWAYAGPEDASFIVQLADDIDGVPGGYVIVGSTDDLQYLLAMPGGNCWVRVYATLNGRDSAPSNAVQVAPVPGFLVTGTASAVEVLQDDVTTINGTLVAHAEQLVDLDARADAVENDIGGLQTTTTALAAADDLLEARVTANEDSITSQATQLTTLSASQVINRSVAGRTPLVFRQTNAPAISGTRYNKLLQTTALNSTASWAKTATVAASTVVDPEGFLQAWRITPAADGQYVRQTVTGLGRIGVDQPAPPAAPVPGRTFTFSVWLRADTAHTATLQLVAPTTGTTETAHVALTNVFQRFSVTHTYLAETDTSLRAEIYPKELGVAGTPNLHIDVALPQLEEGATATAYQRVTVANDYDGNGIPPLSEWYDTDDGNKQYAWQLSSGTMQWVLGADTRIEATATATTAIDARVTTAEGDISTQASRIDTLEVEVDGKAAISVVNSIEARVDQTEAGVLNYYAAYTLAIDVNGYFSGFTSVNNGSSAAFTVHADVFQVLKPGGGDSLSWAGGVITALKSGYSVKIGPGFGSSSNLIFWYGADGSTSTRTVANAKVAITNNGTHKLGSTQLNFGSGWSSGAAVTYSASAGTPATATISVASGVFRFGDQQISFNASSANVSGTGGTTVTYWLYYDDPGLSGGSKTLNASTSGVDTFNSDGRVLIGSVAVTYPVTGTGGGGGGGGGDYCPAVDQWVMTQDGPKRAGDVRVGDLLRLCDPLTLAEAWGAVTHSRTQRAACVRLLGHAGADLTCSTSAPIPVGRGYLDAQDCEGAWTLGRRTRGIAVEQIVSVSPAGERDVQHITVGDRCFWVGADPDHLLLHHNLKPP